VTYAAARATLMSHTTPGSAYRTRVPSSAGRGIRRIRRAWVAIPLPTMEEVEERMRNYRGFFARLTPEQLAIMQSTDEFEVLGDPNGPKRTF
jgi:hypothetical protein